MKPVVYGLLLLALFLLIVKGEESEEIDRYRHLRKEEEAQGRPEKSL